MPKIIENSIWPLSERTAALQCFDHLKIDGANLWCIQHVFRKRLAPECVFNAKKQLFEKFAGSSFFAKARARRRDAFAKSCFRAAFCLTARSRFFCVRFFSFFITLLGPGFEIIAPRALKTCVARTTIGPENNYTFQICTRCSGAPYASWGNRSLAAPFLVPPATHCFADFWMRNFFTRLHHTFFAFVVHVFLHLGLTNFFAPAAIMFLLNFVAQIFPATFCLFAFLYMFSMFLSAFLGNESAGSPGSLFFAWWRSNFGIGVTHFLKIPSCTFWIFWRPKIARIFASFFWQHLSAPRPPGGMYACPEHRRW